MLIIVLYAYQNYTKCTRHLCLATCQRGTSNHYPLDPCFILAPDGDVLKNLPSRNKPTTINGVEFTGHALDRMQENGVISPTAVIDAIHTGISTPGNSSGEVVHTSLSGDLRVVTDPSGTKVITVTPQSPTIHVLE